MNNEPIFDHEKLDVYQVEFSFIMVVGSVVGDPRGRRGFVSRDLRSARGSAVECAACLDALVTRKLATIERIEEGKRLLFRIVGMLTKLVERFDSYRAREDEEPKDEDENGHEHD